MTLEYIAAAPMIADTPGSVSKFEQVIVGGNLRDLTPEQRVTYYRALCESVGLNPLSRPFDYIVLDGRLTLYANRSCTDQLRSIRGVAVTALRRERTEDGLAVVIAAGHDRYGRQDEALGAVSVLNLKGEALANALMKAETKAKRRLTLSLAGLGLLDEIEAESVPGAMPVRVDPLTGAIADTTEAPPTDLPSDLIARRLALEEAAQADHGPAAPADTSPTLPATPPPAVGAAGAGMTRDDFLAGIKEHRISLGYAMSLAGEGVTWADMTDERRATLFADLTDGPPE